MEAFPARKSLWNSLIGGNLRSRFSLMISSSSLTCGTGSWYSCDMPVKRTRLTGDLMLSFARAFRVRVGLTWILIFMDCVCERLKISPEGCLTLVGLPRLELPVLHAEDELEEDTEDTPAGETVYRKCPFVCCSQFKNIILPLIIRNTVRSVDRNIISIGILFSL